MSTQQRNTTSSGASSDDIALLTDQLAAATLQSPSPPRPIVPRKRAVEEKVLVYRAALNDKPWDQVKVKLKLGKGKTYCLEARSTVDDNTVALDTHINMGFRKSTATKRRDIKSSWISFTTDLDWAVYYTLKQELVFGEKRRLIRLRVPKAQIQEYNGSDAKTQAFVRVASECFAHLKIEADEYDVIEIPAKVRSAFQAWKSKRFGKYPFKEWRMYAEARGLTM